MADEVLTERRGRVLVITLNRPDSRNAINSALAQQLVEAIEILDSDPSLTAGVLAGAGGGFCSGMDLKAFAAEGPPKRFTPFIENGSAKPLIAALEGYAVAGGFEIALVCDLLVAARGTRLGIPEVKVGLFAAAGGLLRLQRHVPYGVAMEMCLTGDLITAERAHDYGLVSHLTEPGQALETALSLAERIAANAPLAVAATKRIIRDSQGLTEQEFWDLQKPLVAPVFKSDDAKEGPRAFSEKRAPAWAGR